MSTHSPMRQEYYRPPAREAQNVPAETASDEVATSFPQPPFPPHHTKERQENYTLKLLLWSLVIICMGGLGSFSLAPQFLPRAFVQAFQPAPTPTPVIIPTPTPMSIPSPTPTPDPTADNGCVVATQPITYQGSTKQQPALPPSWFEAGRQQGDFTYAQECAASFVLAYQRLDEDSQPLLEEMTSPLTPGAWLRFYGLVVGIEPDKHLDERWRASIVKQTIQVSMPDLLGMQYANQRLFVWLSVPYHLSTQTKSQKIERDSSMTVLLIAVPPDLTRAKTGWQISGWQEGKSQFTPLEPL